MKAAALRSSWSLSADKAIDDRIILSSDVADLPAIEAPDILAVLAIARPEPWIETLTKAVCDGSFVVPRFILDGVTFPEIKRFLSQLLSSDSRSDTALAKEIRNALRDDLLHLTAHCGELTGAKRFHFRFFTDIPNTRCSFHVDVTPPGAPTTALIRVYCGARTQYVHPDNLTSWEDFHAWEYLRKRQVLAVWNARERHDAAEEMRAAARLSRLDARPDFLHHPDEVHTVPQNAIIACKFVDTQFVRDCVHVRARAARGWIHRSPMSGAPRCVVTINATNTNSH